MKAPELAEVRFAGKAGWWARWAVPVICVGCGLAFIADITHSQTLAFGLFYVPLVCTAVFLRDRRATWWLAVTSTPGSAAVISAASRFSCTGLA